MRRIALQARCAARRGSGCDTNSLRLIMRTFSCCLANSEGRSHLCSSPMILTMTRHGDVHARHRTDRGESCLTVYRASSSSRMLVWKQCVCLAIDRPARRGSQGRFLPRLRTDLLVSALPVVSSPLASPRLLGNRAQGRVLDVIYAQDCVEHPARSLTQHSAVLETPEL